MGADFSRVRSNPLLDYAGAELKQGAVLLDADFNEHVALVDRRLRAAASDILGPSTVSSTTPDAFKITAVSGVLQIGKGRMYVDGLLAENHGTSNSDNAEEFDALMSETTGAGALLLKYDQQPYLPSPPELPKTGRHLVYLDVWEREVTHLEQPDLVEVAVGVETSSRRQIVWQVRVLGAPGAQCGSPDKDIEGWADLIAPSTGRLTTGVFDVPPADDPCELPPTGGYRGLENQTYRVEIQDPGQPGGAATFKWSRENASVGSRVASVISAIELELETLGRDDVLRFKSGDWVEITNDEQEFSQQCGEMRQITVNDEAARRITFASSLTLAHLPGRNLRVRRWDQSGTVLQTAADGTTSVFQDLDATGGTGAIRVPDIGTTLLLENGVTVNFDPGRKPASELKAGDYWVFAARTADASVELLSKAPPRGIHHHYARLAVWDAVASGQPDDCRTLWPPRADGHDCGCTACVTAESHAATGSNKRTIQDAVDAVKAKGGTICIGPGVYDIATMVVVGGSTAADGAHAIKIVGHGRPVLKATPGFKGPAVISIDHSVDISLEDLCIAGGVSAGGAPSLIAGLRIHDSFLVHVHRCQFGDDELPAGFVPTGVPPNDEPPNARHLNPAITLVDSNVDINIQMNVFNNVDVGIQDAVSDGKTAFLARLSIESNLMICRNAGVLLGTLHSEDFFTEIRLANNRIESPFGFSIEGTGLDVTVEANTCNLVIVDESIARPITPAGVRCGISEARISNNRVFGVSDGRAVKLENSTGIVLSGFIVGTQVVGNRIQDLTGVGILLTDGSFADTLIANNQIQRLDGGGIVMSFPQSEMTAAFGLDVVGNTIDAVARAVDRDSPTDNPSMTGMRIVNAADVTVAGNSVDNVGMTPGVNAQRSGVYGSDVLRMRIAGNRVVNIGPVKGVLPLPSFGVALSVAARSQTDVADNEVRRSTLSTTEGEDDRSPWLALVVFESSSRLEPASANASVRGNVLQSFGGSQTVAIVVGGSCIFSENRCNCDNSVRPFGDGGDGAIVSLLGALVIASSNHISRSHSAVTDKPLPGLQIDSGQQVGYCVLGNIVSGQIVVNNQTLLTALTIPPDGGRLNVTA